LYYYYGFLVIVFPANFCVQHMLVVSKEISIKTFGVAGSYCRLRRCWNTQGELLSHSGMLHLTFLLTCSYFHYLLMLLKC